MNTGPYPPPQDNNQQPPLYPWQYPPPPYGNPPYPQHNDSQTPPNNVYQPQPGQFQQPPYPPYNVPPPQQRRRGLWSWYKKQTGFAKVGLGCGLIIGILLLCTCSLAAYGSTLPPAPASPSPQVVATTAHPTATSTLVPPNTSTATPKPTPVSTPKPNYAVLGGNVSDFTKVFGKPANDGGSPTTYLDFQPYSGSPSWDITYKVSISMDPGTDNKYHVSGITFTAPPENPVSWQDGVNFCQSFLPTDAVHQSDTDFSPPNQEYQSMYMSKKMAHMFSADLFVEGTAHTTPVTPGTIQIFYFYSSFYDHTTSGAQITSCYIDLGQPH